MMYHNSKDHILVSDAIEAMNNSREDDFEVATYSKRREKHMCKTMNQLERCIENWRNLKVMKEEIDKELGDVEKEIISYLDFNKKMSEIGKDFSVRLSTCERRTIDTKALENDLGSLADYQRVSQYRRLYVR